MDQGAMQTKLPWVRAAQTGNVCCGKCGTGSRCPGYCNSTGISEKKSLRIFVNMQIKPRATAVLGWTGICLLPTWTVHIFLANHQSVFCLPAPSMKTFSAFCASGCQACDASEKCLRGPLPRKAISAYISTADRLWWILRCLWLSVYIFKLKNIIPRLWVGIFVCLLVFLFGFVFLFFFKAKQ